MKIWKYKMIGSDCTFKMPVGAEALSCQMQGLFLCLWALVDETQDEREDRAFSAINTGGNIPFPGDCLKFIDTVQERESGIVWHVFEICG